MPETLLDILESMPPPKLSAYERREMDRIMDRVIAVLQHQDSDHGT